jgi:hypothetical protein
MPAGGASAEGGKRSKTPVVVRCWVCRGKRGAGEIKMGSIDVFFEQKRRCVLVGTQRTLLFYLKGAMMLI